MSFCREQISERFEQDSQETPRSATSRDRAVLAEVWILNEIGVPKIEGGSPGFLFEPCTVMVRYPSGQCFSQIPKYLVFSITDLSVWLSVN